MAKKSKLHPNVVWLGLASMFNDMSGEIVARALPLFLSGTMGVGGVIIGLIEGVAETTSSLLKIVSGWYSDKFKTRKMPTLAGYTLTAIARPLLLIPSYWLVPLISRFVDRAGKGVRTSPRDALIADSVAAGERGRAFGYQRALDPLGAVFGALIAAVASHFLMPEGVKHISEYVFTILVYLAIIPTFISVIIVAIFVKNIRHKARSSEGKLNLGTQTNLVFRKYLMIVGLFTLGMSSDAFLLLRSADVGLLPSQIFLLVAAFNLVTALSSYPAGKLSDKVGKKKIIIIGWLYYGAVYIGFAFAESPVIVAILYVVYGLFYGLTEGVEKAFVADIVPADKRGTSYGYFNAVVGLVALPASIAFGFLWQEFGSEVAFGSGAVLALIASTWLFFGIKK